MYLLRFIYFVRFLFLFQYFSLFVFIFYRDLVWMCIFWRTLFNVFVCLWIVRVLSIIILIIFSLTLHLVYHLAFWCSWFSNLNMVNLFIWLSLRLRRNVFLFLMRLMVYIIPILSLLWLCISMILQGLVECSIICI